MRSPNSSALNPLTRDLSGLGFVELQNWHVLYHMLVKVINLSRNVQLSWPLLELRGKHVVVFQMKVPQITLISHLFTMLRRASPFDFCPILKLLLIVHASS